MVRSEKSKQKVALVVTIFSGCVLLVMLVAVISFLYTINQRVVVGVHCDFRDVRMVNESVSVLGRSTTLVPRDASCDVRLSGPAYLLMGLS